METLLDLFPIIRRLGRREAVRWSAGYRTSILSYADLLGRIGACAKHLTDSGLRKGDRVLIVSENRPEWVAVFWACVAKGIHAVPVDYRFSAELTERIRADSGARLVIDGESMDRLAKLSPVPEFAVADVTPDDIVEIVYTSGTTGEPKGVVHRHRNICANLGPFQKEIAKYHRWASPFQPIRMLDLLPLSHMFGQSQGLFMPLFLEGAVAFTEEVHPNALLRIVRENRISAIVCVPRMLEMLRNEIERRFRLPASPQTTGIPGVFHRWWRYRKVHSGMGWKFWAFLVGGARVDPELEEFWYRLGYVVVQGYGLTEASPVVAVNHPFGLKRGSLGKAVPGQEVTLAPDGEILVRGASVAGATDEAGWLHTGDLGEMDADGRLYYRGRKKDIIVTPEGLNVFPDDVEAVLNQFPGIRQSAVVSMNDRVHAALILADPSASVEDIIRQANGRLETHQRIRAWSVWPDDDFPRTASTMKIRRAEVAERLRTGHAPAPEALPDPGGMSSLERVELLSELEARHGIEIDEEAFAKINTAEELKQLLVQPRTTPAASTNELVSRPLSAWPMSLPVRLARAAFQRVFAVPVFRRYLPLTVEGVGNLAGLEPPVLFAVNHSSDLDTPAVFAALPANWRRRLAPAMRANYFDDQRFHYLLARLLYNGYPLPQEMAGVRRALATTEDLARRGYCPLVFPEGRRTPDGTLQSFRPGIGMMAVRLGIPVVPIRLRGLFEIYPAISTWPKRGPVHASIGAPLKFAGDTSYESATDAIRKSVEDL